MCGLLVMCGQVWGEPWEGKHAGGIEGGTPGPHHGPLPGGSLRSVPRPIEAQMERRAARNVAPTPQGACRCPAPTARVGTAEALPHTAWLLAQPVAGLRIADCHGHRPAVARRVDEVGGASRQRSGAQGCEGWERLSWPGPCGGMCARTSPPHAPHEAPRPPRRPQAIPGVALRARCAGVGRPPVAVWARGLGEPSRSPCVRGAPRRLGVGGGGTS